MQPKSSKTRLVTRRHTQMQSRNEIYLTNKKKRINKNAHTTSLKRFRLERIVVKSGAPEPAKNKERKSEKRDLRRSSASGLDDRLWIYAEETRQFIEVCTIRSHGAAWGIHNGEGKKRLYVGSQRKHRLNKKLPIVGCVYVRALFLQKPMAINRMLEEQSRKLSSMFHHTVVRDIPLGWFLNAYKYVNCRRWHRGTRWRYQKAKGPKAVAYMNEMDIVATCQIGDFMRIKVSTRLHWITSRNVIFSSNIFDFFSFSFDKKTS